MHTQLSPSIIDFSHAKKISYRPWITGFFIVVLFFFCILAPQGYCGDNSLNLTDLVRLAEQGDAEAQFSLAQLYEEGRIIAPDPKKAVAWLTRAARQDLPVACLYLGMKFEFGNGVQQDTKVAGELYEQAAVHGWAMAQYLLAMLMLEDASIEKRLTALAWLRLASEQEYPQAKERYLERHQTLTQHERDQLDTHVEQVARRVKNRSSEKN